MTPIEQYRNVGIYAALGSAKSALTGRLLSQSEELYELGVTPDGAACVVWTGADGRLPTHRINVVRTPDNLNLPVDLDRSLRVLDGAVITCCAVDGLAPRIEAVWRRSVEKRVPRIAFVDGMDRPGADFLRSVEQMNTRLGGGVVPVQLNIGSAEGFAGFVDLVQMRAVVWGADTSFAYQDIPVELQEPARALRQRLIQAALPGAESPSEVDLKRALRQCVLNGSITPVTCGSTRMNRGVQALQDAVVDYLPAPSDVPAIEDVTLNDQATMTVRPAADNEPFAALVFKVVTDPFGGNLTFFRVYSGVVTVGDTVLRSGDAAPVRVARVVQLRGGRREDIREVRAGDVAAAVGLVGVIAGDTLCALIAPILLERVTWPEPVLSVLVEPKTEADREKMALLLPRLTGEDSSLRVWTDPASNGTVLGGMSELQLNSAVDRLRREGAVECNLSAPRVTYRGNPVVSEPLMSVEVDTPEEYVDNVVSDLKRRRATVDDPETGPRGAIVRAVVPLAEILGYAMDLHSTTAGRASYMAQFVRFS